MNASVELLRAAVDRLTAIGPGAEQDERQREAAAWSAALAHPAPGAATEWYEVFTGAQFDFDAAAARGRPWLSTPTPQLRKLLDDDASRATDYARALADVASAACSLGEPTL